MLALLLGGGLVMAAVGAAAIEFHLSVPFGLAFLAGALWFGAMTALARRPGLQNAALSLTALLFCLAAAEVAAALFAPPQLRKVRITPDNYFVHDRDLGYAPPPNTQNEVEEFFGSKLIYRVTYDIDGNGLRRMPAPGRGAPCQAAFFADSFTFGEGVSDREAMPYQFVLAAHGRYQGYNFSFHGYGPHQMLRALETGRVERIVKGPVQLVVYQGFTEHLARAAGHTYWDLTGPRYVLDAKGRLHYRGPFHSRFYRLGFRLLDRSRLFDLVERRIPIFSGEPKAVDLPLFMAILERARSEIRRRFGATFVVLFWDDDDSPLTRMTLQRLAAEKFDVIRVSSIIPDIRSNAAAYRLSPHDGHPSALADRRIAQYLAAKIGPQACKSSVPAAHAR